MEADGDGRRGEADGSLTMCEGRETVRHPLLFKQPINHVLTFSKFKKDIREGISTKSTSTSSASAVTYVS